jgi:tetratricopeptide (TPR) repeat protein
MAAPPAVTGARAAAAGLAVGLAMLGIACAGPPRGEDARPLRLSRLDEPDPTRRASVRLVVQGLDADTGGRSAVALGLYERALQIDPTNPYAYLALARHSLESGDPGRAVQYLDQAEVLLGPADSRNPGVEAHLEGLRGAALQMTGYGADSEDRLERARVLAPEVWGDGRLDADELR